jgi:hypothetical protein
MGLKWRDSEVGSTYADCQGVYTHLVANLVYVCEPSIGQSGGDDLRYFLLCILFITLVYRGV